MEPSNASHGWDGKMASCDDSEDDDYRPARTAFHEDPAVCTYMLGTVTATVPLKIAASQIASPGSGLFVTKDIMDGEEIFRSQIPFVCVEPYQTTVCHYCLEDTGSRIHHEEGRFCAGDDVTAATKRCSGCRVARFCSTACHKRAWKAFHKDECKILKDAPPIPAHHLIAYRILFWQNRDLVTSGMGKALNLLENHFVDYLADSDEATHIYEVAMAIRQMTQTKLALRAVWRLVPAIMTNAIGIRSAGRKEPHALGLDLVASVINHSCDPNAFVFHEGGKIHVRSLRPICAGEEITVSYVAMPTDVYHRRLALKKEHFFDCYCKRCSDEHKEHTEMFDRDPTKLNKLHQAQDDILRLLIDTNKALLQSTPPHRAFDVDNAETSLRTITCQAFPPGDWPAHIDPLPHARLTLALLYSRRDDKPRPALLNALRGTLPTTRYHRAGPDWVANLLDLARILLVVTGATATTTSVCVTPPEAMLLACGILGRLRAEAAGVFGLESGFVVAVGKLHDSLAGMVAEVVPGTKPGTGEFEKEFVRVQGKLLAWAGIDEIHGVSLP